jgi:diacylglycerol kinase family enzyme
VSRLRWLARLSIALAAGAVVVLVVFAGLHSFGVLFTAALGLCVTIACAYWFLARRGVLRWAALLIAVLVPVALNVLYASLNLLWVALLSAALLAAGVLTAGLSMGSARRPKAARELPAARPRHAFLIMNPRSGGGKVGKFGLREKAAALGADVAMLEGPTIIDVAALARQAVADGADLLGVAGGDGTQALVAGVAAEHDVPFLCISAGTRNHFAMDLGLDRDDPSGCLDALTDGVECRIDLGRIGDRTFVNNASFGAYAEIVRSPAYRDDKRGTTLQMLPDLLSPQGNGHRLEARAGNAAIAGPQAVLVSNNAYDMNDIAGLGRRSSLDSGTLGLIAVTVDNAAEAISLIGAGRGRGLAVLSAPEVTVDAEEAEIPVGIDGETVMMPTPVRCQIEPGALRVVVPRNRPGVRPARRPFSWSRLGQLAAFGRQLPEPELAPDQPSWPARSAAW